MKRINDMKPYIQLRKRHPSLRLPKILQIVGKRLKKYIAFNVEHFEGEQRSSVRNNSFLSRGIFSIFENQVL